MVMWLKLDIGDDGKANYELECRNLSEPGTGIPADLLQKVVPRILADLVNRQPILPSQQGPWAGNEDLEGPDFEAGPEGKAKVSTGHN